MISLRSVVVWRAESSRMRFWFVRCSAQAPEGGTLDGGWFMGITSEESIQTVPLLSGRK